MSEVPRKRVAGDQLTRDDDGEDRADSEFVQTPQIADAAEMATRRVLRVRRGEQQAQPTTNEFASAGFAFKDASVGGSAAPAVKPSFGFAAPSAGSGSTAPPGFSFAAPAPSSASSSTTAATAPPSFGFATAAKPPAPAASSGFTFGSAASNASTSPASTTATPTSFSFGAPANSATAPSTGGSGFGATTATAPSSSAGSATATGNGGNGGFSFGFTPAAKSAESAPAKKDDAAPASSGAPAPLFGAGSFNFGMAVNSFVEARKKMEEEKQDKKGESDADDDDDADAPKDDADGTGFGSEVVAQTARDVLANGPSKLFLFEKGEAGAAGRWVERGTGEARLIAEEKKTETGTHVHRLLVRAGYALNATVRKNLFTLSKTEAKHLIIAVATTEGPHTYLLKFTGANAEANTTKFSEEIKKIMDAAEKSS